MLKDITLGQYFPGTSVIHKLDPRTKIILIIAYIACLFIATGYVSYMFMIAVLAVWIILSQIKLRAIFKGLKPLVIIITITALLNILFTTGTVIAEFWIFHITKEGIRIAAFMALRIIMLVTGTSLLTYTTSPISLTDGLESLMRPLKRIKVPVHELSMMMSIALRFIPTLIEEADKIINAQRSRGADFESGGLIKRAKALLPILVPLFVSAFRRADELAVAMESRCYHGDEGRTRMKKLAFARRDAAAFVIGAAVMTAVIVLARLGY